MSGLADFTHYQAEALIFCLAASIVWAGALLLGARSVERSAPMSSAEKLWTAALLFAVLPSLVAPTLAGFGVSLRAAPEPAVYEAMTVMTTSAEFGDQSAAAPKAALVTTEQAISAAALLYVYGVFLTFFLWAARQGGLRYAVARASCVEDRNLLARIEEWAERLGVRTPAIRRSMHVSSVCICGVARQTILIPEGIEARVSTDDLVLMCAHELAHVRRGDTRLFTATQLARVLFWFNPLVARIASNAELAAEESADALVLEKGVDRRAYAACFVEGLKFAAAKVNGQPALVPSFTPSDRNGRRRRLNSILSPEPRRKTPLATRLMLSAAASTVALVAVGQAALAVNPESAGERRTAIKELPLIGDFTKGFDETNEVVRRGDAHNGLDIQAPKGAKIFAPGDGVVVEATDRYRGEPAWGKVVVIDHGHGVVTRYAHLDSYKVRKGERVKTGDVVAAVGATGKVTGPHLHFETLRDGEVVDPASLITAAPVPADAPEPAAAPAPVEAADPAAPAFAPSPVESARPAQAVRFSFNLLPADKQTRAPSAPPRAAAMPFSHFKMVSPVIPGAPMPDLNGFAFNEGGEFTFADGTYTTDLMFDDIEQRLLGALDGDGATQYNLSFSDGEKTWRFSSDEPMTAEKRAELRRALKEMKKRRAKDREHAREMAEHARERARHERGMRRDHDAEMAREAAREARANVNAEAYAWNWSDEDIKEIRRQVALSKREALEAQRDAIEGAAEGLDQSVAESLEEAISDLEDAELDLEEEDLSAAEMREARRSIAEARRELEQGRRDHERAIDEARRELERERAQIERELDRLDGLEYDRDFDVDRDFDPDAE